MFIKKVKINGHLTERVIFFSSFLSVTHFLDYKVLDFQLTKYLELLSPQSYFKVGFSFLPYCSQVSPVVLI